MRDFQRREILKETLAREQIQIAILQETRVKRLLLRNLRSFENGSKLGTAVLVKLNLKALPVMIKTKIIEVSGATVWLNNKETLICSVYVPQRECGAQIKSDLELIIESARKHE